MVLTIDAGNTRTKWALFNADGNICHQDMCLNAEIATANLLPNTLSCDQIVISNVAGAQHAEQLQQRICAYQATTNWITASKQTANVINHYLSPESLGTDRWAALIAAWHLHHSTCIVINAGTATTIDTIICKEIDGETYGEFIGGMILPGIELMQKSLGTATAQLPKTITDANTFLQAATSPFATTTINAIYSGAVNATSSAIKQVTQILEQQYMQTPKLIISGGNASLIQQNLADKNSADTTITQAIKTVTIADHLVLQGLYLLSTPAIKQISQSTSS